MTSYSERVENTLLAPNLTSPNIPHVYVSGNTRINQLWQSRYAQGVPSFMIGFLMIEYTAPDSVSFERETITEVRQEVSA